MILIQLFSLFLLCNTIFAFSINPDDISKEDPIKLIVDSDKGTKVREYYFLNHDGLSFTVSDLEEAGFKIGDNINLQIMSRTYIASSIKKRKKYQFNLRLRKYSYEDEPFTRNLTYSKKTSSVVSPEGKPGFSFTEAGYWFEDFSLRESFNLDLNPIDGQKVYIRVLAYKNEDIKKKKRGSSPVDYQKNISIYTNAEDTSWTKDWYLLTKINKQQFKLKANSFYKVYSRLIIDDNKVDIIRYYDFHVKENNQKLGNYLFEGPNSTSSAYIKTNYLDIYNKVLGKENYFSLTVPEPKDENKNYSYYTFDVGANDTNKVLIKIIEYGTSKK